MDLREIDRLVAEHVMGWKLFESCGETWACTNQFGVASGHKGCCAKRRVQQPGDRLMFKGHQYGWFGEGWSPSSNISDAMEVVEHCRQRWYEADPHETKYWEFVDCGQPGWRVDVMWAHHDGDVVLESASAETLTLAICVVALWALGVEVPCQFYEEARRDADK